jgi:putative acetyltransferase
MPEENFHLRSVEASDVPAVVDLVREVLAEFSLTFGEGSTTDEELWRLPGSYTARGGAFWVAVDDATRVILGTCGLAAMEPGVFELRKMYLRPETRGRGVGRRLLRGALDFARSVGASRVVLDTTEQMKSAIAFYEAHGFVRDDRYIHGSRCTRGYVLAL